ncbi:MAG: protein TolQ [Gammaproteobacteria bacterium]|nr:protein TolQ [Gammaproteobacteria bacterium]
MNADMSFISLFSQASFIVQLVMAALLLASIISWVFIFQKSRMLSRARRDADRFEDTFWSGGNLRDLYSTLQEKNTTLRGMERIFEAGFSEFTRHIRNRNAAERVVDSSHRVMRVTLSRELDDLETNLNFLATVGSTSPYVGLFGTVWGIMNAFRGLANVQQATLSMVAPGIAEALIATAMGLVAAIPAVIAYNRFSRQVERMVNRYENFMEEFSALIQRQVFTKEE